MSSNLIFGNGYLMKHLIPSIGDCYFASNLQEVEEILASNIIRNVWYFACPTDLNKTLNKCKLIQTPKLTLDLIELCNESGSKLIYASSEGALNIEDSRIWQKAYNALKFVNTLQITELCDEYLILYIPRVYSADRTSGLMELLRKGQIPKVDKKLEYLDVKDFVYFTLKALESNAKEFFYPKEKSTILGIYERYFGNGKH